MPAANGHAPRTREPQYQFELDAALRDGFARFGIMSNQTWRDDPRRLLFVLSRYKFVAKMLAGKRRVLEVGCADAFGTRLVQQEVGAVTGRDVDPVFENGFLFSMNDEVVHTGFHPMAHYLFALCAGRKG